MGLSIPDRNVCHTTDACNGNLKWGDGTVFRSRSWLDWEVRSNDGLDCYRTKTSKNKMVDDVLCNSTTVTLCQITCETGQ